MKSKNPSHSSSLFFTLCIAACLPSAVIAADFTWDGAPDGGGSSADSNWSTATNWVGDVAPSSGTVVTTTATVTLSSTTLTDVDTTGIQVGSEVSGTGIDTGTTVTAINSGLGTVELSLAAIADGSLVDITFTPSIDNLIFDGSVGLANINDFVTNIDNPAFTFAATAGAFVISDNGLTGPLRVGTQAGNTVVATVKSTANQELALDLVLAGTQKYRDIIFGDSAVNESATYGTLTLSGDLNFVNDQLSVPGDNAGSGFYNETGTLVLSGNNSGDGRGGVINAGTNTMRGSLNLSHPCNLVLGSPTALGNPNLNSASLRGMSVSSGNVVITTLNDMNLTGLDKVDNTITYHQSTAYAGLGNFEFGGLISTATNGRAFSVSGAGAGEVTISGQGVYLTQRTAAQLMILQPLDGNVLTINGPIHDTFQSGGIETQTTGYGSLPTDGVLRLQGDGTVNINADNLATFNGETLLNSANLTVKLGNANALGTWVDTIEITPTEVMSAANYYFDVPILYDIDPTGISVGDVVSGPNIPVGTVVTAINIDELNISASTVDIDQSPTGDGTATTLTFSGTTTTGTYAGRTNMNAGRLDLNGFAVHETFVNLATNHRFINSNTGTAAQVLTEIVNQGVLRVDGPGDLIFNNVRHTGGITRSTIKDGAGTLTLGGDLSNNRYGLTVNEGNVILAKTDGEAVNRFPLVMNNAASTVTLTIKSHQIGDQTDANGLHQINEGTLELNGFDESLAALSTSLGTEPGGVVTNTNGGSTSTFTLLGVVGVDATWPGTLTGNLNLVKAGANMQTFSGTVSHTGDTTINGGSLELSATSDLADSSAVNINGATSILKLANGVTDTVNELWIDGGQVEAGTYGATGSGAENIDDMHFAGTGVLDVTTGDPVATDYDTWAALYSPADLSDMAGDNDNDGLTNQQEYAFGLNPVSGASVSPYLASDLAGGTFTYQRRATTDLDYTIETSPDLSVWTPDAGAIQDATPAGDNENVLVTPSGPLPTTKFFFRVKAD